VNGKKTKSSSTSAERDVTLNGGLMCAYDVSVEDTNDINAYADGKRIVFNVGMIRFAGTDEELATVVGYELAHNILKHPQEAQTGAVIGGLFGVLLDSEAEADGANNKGIFRDMGTNMGARAYSVKRERETDYVGLYLMERAGYDSSNAASFWRRMGAEHPGSIERSGLPFNDTHPSAPERFLALQVIHDENADKRRRRRTAYSKHQTMKPAVLLSVCAALSACATPPPEVSERPLSRGFVKIEATGNRATETREIREVMLIQAARATVERGSVFFIIADEVRGASHVPKQRNSDHGIAPSFGVLETSTRQPIDLGPDPVSVETKPQPFGSFTIEVFDQRPSNMIRTVYDAAAVLTLAGLTQ